MCNQAVGLIAAELERRGVTTAAISLLRFVSDRVGAPRTLFGPRPHGFPLGDPGDDAEQRRTLRAMLVLTRHDGPPPTLATYGNEDPLPTANDER
jgi:hypothetical protein